MSRDFCVLVFFHKIAPPGPIRGTLRRFRFFQKIRQDIQQKVGSAVYCIMIHRGMVTWRCILHRRVAIPRCIIHRFFCQISLRIFGKNRNRRSVPLMGQGGAI